MPVLAWLNVWLADASDRRLTAPSHSVTCSTRPFGDVNHAHSVFTFTLSGIFLAPGRLPRSAWNVRIAGRMNATDRSLLVNLGN